MRGFRLNERRLRERGLGQRGMRGGAPRFADNALVALALLTAESAPAQKDLLVRLTINLMVDPATSARA